MSVRVDALTDSESKSEETASVIGVENRTKLESRLRALEHEMEGGGVRRFADNAKIQETINSDKMLFSSTSLPFPFFPQPRQSHKPWPKALFPLLLQ